MSVELEHKIEAILFAAGEPVELERLALALEIELPAARQQAESLAARLDREESPLQVLLLEGKYQLATRPAYAPVIRAAMELKRQQPLSQAAMEVLAIVAYNQPVTRAFVDQVRGVDSTGVMASLVEKGLVEEASRLELPGRPIAYRTGDVFLRTFGMSSLQELPMPPQEEEQQELSGV